MRTKFIINNNSTLTDESCFEAVSHVIKKGKISKSTYGNQYCFLTNMCDYDKTFSVMVYCKLTKTGTTIFYVSDKQI